MERQYQNGRITPHGDGDAVIAVESEVLNTAVLVIVGALKSGFTFEELVMAVGAVSVGQHLEAQEFFNCVGAGRSAGTDGLIHWEKIHEMAAKIKTQPVKRTDVSIPKHEIDELFKKDAP